MIIGLIQLIKRGIYILEYNFFLLNNFEFKLFFVFDWIRIMFAGVVLFISGIVIIYRNDYIKEEKYKIYFLYGVLLFVGSMVLIIFRPNLFIILLGWDGLGLVSYCLVIYYQNYKSDTAGIITILRNRIGDVIILLSFVFLLNFGSLDFFVFTKIYWICGYILIIAGITKRAQIPFSAWLPAAIAAPTPVSSLVHSSTLVTAGVYLLIRLNLLMEVKNFSNFLLFFSILTMMMAGMGAMLETDLKKVIALSTLRQLGLIIIILSLGKIDLSFFHLITHALFKAILFLCAGFIIHRRLGNQDIRFIGSFYLSNPFIGVAFRLANMSLFGIPFLSGFYSKDLILEYIYISRRGFFFLIIIILSTVCTTIYSLRVIFYSLWRGGLKITDFNYHWSIWIEIPIFIIGVTVIFFGSIINWILVLDYEIILVNFEVKMINIGIILGGSIIFFVIFEKIGEIKLGIFGDFLGKIWFISSFSGSIFSKNLIGGVNLYNYDNSWIEELGPQGIYKFNIIVGVIINWFQFNSFKNIIYFCVFLLILIL